MIIAHSHFSIFCTLQRAFTIFKPITVTQLPSASFAGGNFCFKGESDEKIVA